MRALFLKSCTEPMVLQLVDTSLNSTVIDSITDTEIIYGKTSTMLLYGIEQLVARNQLKLQEVDAIYMASGPGSYTGARMLVSIVKTLHIVFPDIPVYDVSLLSLYTEMSRKQSIETGASINTLGIVFARRNKYYIHGAVNGLEIPPQVMDTESVLTYLTEAACYVNGVLYTDVYDLKHYVELPMSIKIWQEISQYIKDLDSFEPYYLEDVKIG